MVLDRKAYDAYDAKVRALADAAAKKLRAAAAAMAWGDDAYDAVGAEAARDELMGQARAMLDAYGDAAAAAAAEYYDQVAFEAGVNTPSAVLADVVGDDQLYASLRYAARHLYGDGGKITPELFAQYAAEALRRYIKKAANDTMAKNAVRDGQRHGVRFARIPSGAETCAFCLMLASRGFVYANAASAGEFNHYHDHCDCRVVAGFGDDVRLEGYDAGRYVDLYVKNEVKNSDGTIDAKATLSAMRKALAGS